MMMKKLLNIKKAFDYYLTAARDPNVTTAQLRVIAEEFEERKMFNESADVYERLVSRADFNIEDLKGLVRTRYEGKRFAQAAHHAEAVLGHPDASDDDKQSAEDDIARSSFFIGEFEKAIESWPKSDEFKYVRGNIFATLHHDFEGAAERRKALWGQLGISDNEKQIYLEWMGHPSDAPYQGKITKTPDELRLNLEKLYEKDQFLMKFSLEFSEIMKRILFILEFQAGNKEMADNIMEILSV